MSKERNVKIELRIQYSFHLQITESNYHTKITLVDKMIEIMFENGRQVMGLQTVSNFLRVTFSSLESSDLRDRINDWYKVHLAEEPKSTAQKSQASNASEEPFCGTKKIVDFWCFSPAFG